MKAHTVSAAGAEPGVISVQEARAARIGGTAATTGDSTAVTTPTRPGAVLAVSTVAVFMAFLDATIVNIAFPAIHRSFPDVAVFGLSWILNAYNVTVAALLIPAGRLVDRMGRRRGLYAGLGLFLGGSMLCGLAPGVPALIASRVLQAAGAATLIPASFGLVLHAFPPDKRVGATSAWAAAGAVAAAAGPSLGGVLVEQAGWRWIFYINLVVALGMLAAPRVLTESRESDTRPLDILGGVLLAGALAVLALAIVEAPTWGWGASLTLVCGFVALELGRASVRHGRRHTAPILDPELLAIRSFTLANLGLLLFSVAFYALLLANVLFLTQVWGYSVLQAGFAVTPGPLAAAIGAGLAGRAIKRVGPRPVAIFGMVLFAIAALEYRRVGPLPDYAGHWLPVQIPSGIGIGCALAALAAASVAELPADNLATGSALTSCFRQIGAVLGIAGVIAIIGHATLFSAMPDFRLAWLGMAGAALLAIVPTLALGRPARAISPEADELVARAAARRRTIVGFSRCELTVGGGTVSFWVGGEGPALLLVHGLLDDSLTWRRLAPKLARRYRVIIPDLPGHGRSGPAGHGDYSPGGHALILRTLLDQLGYDQVGVVGHSLGASVAMIFAGLAPRRIARLALIAPGGFGRELNPWLCRLTTRRAQWVLRLFVSAPGRAALVGAARLLPRLGATRLATSVSAALPALERLADPVARHAFLASTGAVIDRHGQVGCASGFAVAWRSIPSFVAWGMADRVIPAEHAFTVADLRPDADIVLFERTGHHPHLTRTDALARRLLRFLETGQAPASGPIPDTEVAGPLGTARERALASAY